MSPARFPKPAKQNIDPKWLKRIVFLWAFSSSTLTMEAFFDFESHVHNVACAG
jgi:hypothetical protein